MPSHDATSLLCYLVSSHNKVSLGTYLSLLLLFRLLKRVLVIQPWSGVVHWVNAVGPHVNSWPLQHLLQVRNSLIIAIDLNTKTGAFNSQNLEASERLFDEAETLLASKSLLGTSSLLSVTSWRFPLDQPVINVAKGMLLVANYAYSVGKIHKSSSYCLLVLHHSSLMDKQLALLAGRLQLVHNLPWQIVVTYTYEYV